MTRTGEDVEKREPCALLVGMWIVAATMANSMLFSLSVVSDFFQPYGLQQARLPCTLPPCRACSNSCPFSRWCHPTMSSLSPLLLLSSIFPSVRVFSNEFALHIRWPEYWSFSINISPCDEYSGLISINTAGLISLQSKGLSEVFSNTTVQKHQFFGVQPSLWSNSHGHTWLVEKP